MCADRGPTPYTRFRRDAQHRPAGHTDDTDVERADGRRVARDLYVRQRGPTVADGRDVGRRAADLDDDPVVDPVRTQRAGHGRGRAGVQRAGRRPSETREIGRASVAAHDHDLALDACAGNTVADDLGRAQRDRQDRRVQRGGDRPQLEPVEAAQLGRGRDGQPGTGRRGSDGPFVGHVVRRECLRHRDRLRAACTHAFDRGDRRGALEAAGDIEELRNRVKHAAFTQLDAGLDRPLLGLPEIGRAAHADHADGRDVALEQRVDGLCRRVGDQLDVGGADAVGELRHDVDHTCRDTVGVVVGRGHDGFGRHGTGCGVEGHGFGERSADVDADPDTHLVAAATAGAVLWRNRGRRTKRYSAPNT